MSKLDGAEPRAFDETNFKFDKGTLSKTLAEVGVESGADFHLWDGEEPMYT